MLVLLLDLQEGAATYEGVVLPQWGEVSAGLVKIGQREVLEPRPSARRA